MERFLVGLGFSPWWAAIPREYREEAARQHVREGVLAVGAFLFGAWAIIAAYTWAEGLSHREPHALADAGAAGGKALASAIVHPESWGK